jgi:hypothetical protein
MKSLQKSWLVWCLSLIFQPKRLKISLREMGSGLLALVLLNASWGVPVHPQAPNEYQVKAAFLYNFARFIEWPAELFKEETLPLVVGVLGEDPFGSALDQSLNGKSINGRPLTIKRLKWGQNLRECQLLFISASEKKRLAQILDSLKGAGVVTISDLNNFCPQGGMIGFILEENKVRFVINLGVAEQARLRISSKLLKLAKEVLGERHAGRN